MRGADVNASGGSSCCSLGDGKDDGDDDVVVDVLVELPEVLLRFIDQQCSARASSSKSKATMLSKMS